MANQTSLLKYSLKTNIVKSILFEVISKVSNYYYVFGRSKEWPTVSGVNPLTNNTEILSSEEDPPGIPVSYMRSFVLEISDSPVDTKMRFIDEDCVPDSDSDSTAKDGVLELRHERSERIFLALLARVSLDLLPADLRVADLDVLVTLLVRGLRVRLAGGHRLARLLLQGRDEVRDHLRRDDDARLHRRADHVVLLGVGDLLLRERLHLAEREREVERRVRDGAEVRVRAGRGGARRVVAGHDREVHLTGLVRHGAPS